MSSDLSGYAYSLFVTEPEDDLKCLICLGVARDPLQHEECGRMFCKWCIEKHGKDKPCPNCRDQDSSYYINKRGKRAIGALAVKCSNAEGKCEWEGTVETLDQHTEMCQYALLPCTKGCKDESGEVVQVLRKDLVDHLVKDCPLRDHQCQHCGERGTYFRIMGVHSAECEKKPVSCPECGENMLQGRKRQHMAEVCEVVILPCKYAGLGCGVKMRRQDMAAHEQDDKVHLHMAIDAINTIQKGKAWVKRFKISKSREFYSRSVNNSCEESAMVYTIGLDYLGSHVSVFFKLRCYVPEIYNWPLCFSVTFTLLNQVEDNNHHSETCSLTIHECDLSKEFGRANFIPHSKLGYDPIKNTQYLKDDIMYLKMVVEIQDDPKPWLMTWN